LPTAVKRKIKPPRRSGGAGRSTIRELDQLTDTYLECRLEHTWIKRTWHKNATGMIVRHAECRECKTTKDELLRTDGSLSRRQYHWPDDYLLRGKSDRSYRIVKADIREILIGRQNLNGLRRVK